MEINDEITVPQNKSVRTDPCSIICPKCAFWTFGATVLLVQWQEKLTHAGNRLFHMQLVAANKHCTIINITTKSTQGFVNIFGKSTNRYTICTGKAVQHLKLVLTSYCTKKIQRLGVSWIFFPGNSYNGWPINQLINWRVLASHSFSMCYSWTMVNRILEVNLPLVSVVPRDILACYRHFRHAELRPWRMHYNGNNLPRSLLRFLLIAKSIACNTKDSCSPLCLPITRSFLLCFASFLLPENSRGSDRYQ